MPWACRRYGQFPIKADPPGGHQAGTRRAWCRGRQGLAGLVADPQPSGSERTHGAGQ